MVQKQKSAKKQKKASAKKSAKVAGVSSKGQDKGATGAVTSDLRTGEAGQVAPDVTPGEGPVIKNPIISTGPITRPFPILLNINPTISSLSPSGAVVGSSDFTLTVLGSNFGTASTVTWNQSPRKTTLVSGTQLTAAISAADLGVVQNASVQVSNPGLLATGGLLFSNSVTFAVIPDVSAIISQLQAITAIPAQLLAELQTYITIKQSEVDTLTAQVSTDQTTAASLNSQIANLQTQVAQQQVEINTLQQQLQASKAQSASPFDVAQSFKSVVDQIQQAAQAAGGVQTTVSNMNVQLKSLVSVQAATATAPASASLIFPDPTALPDPQHLSTLSFSFGSIPHLSSPAATGTPVPPTPGPSNVVGASPAPAPAQTTAPAAVAAPKVEAAGAAAPAKPQAAKVTAPKTPPAKAAGAKSESAAQPATPVTTAVGAEKISPAKAVPAKSPAKSATPVPAKSKSVPSK